MNRVTSRMWSRRRHVWPAILVAALIVACVGGDCRAEGGQQHSTSLTVLHGPVNGVCIDRDGRRAVVYGDPQRQWKTADLVLFTHARRDVVWAGRALVQNGAQCVVPAAEAEFFAGAERFWAGLWNARFHDYAQQGTKVPTASMKVGRQVTEGDVIDLEGLPVRVVDTPGYTRGAVSYFVDIEGTRYGFVGDLICGDGQLLDLYSLQDGVAEAKIGGYHGYAGRLGQLIASLRKVAAQKPDILVPARGPVIEQPASAIRRLIERLQAAYSNYLSVSAGRWYFKDRYDVLARRVLGDAPRVEWMPYAGVIEKAPDWVATIDNSRLLISQDRSGLLIDCGSQAIFDHVQKLRDDGRLARVEGLFITHYHDDHTDWVNEFIDKHGCPVYVTPIMEDVLRCPGAHRLPAMTAKPITRLKVVPDGYHTRWKEFALTFYDYPGQTIYHDALLAEKDGGEKVFFVGDSFTPSGMDDYCLQNRNFLREGLGYLYCLDHLRNKIPPHAFLVNEHVTEPFRFDGDQISLMGKSLEQRRAILSEMFPWDDVNYGIDEQWARMYPYGQESAPGRQAETAVKLLNHSPKRITFTVHIHAPSGFEVEPATLTVTADPRQEVEARFRIKVPDSPAGSVHVITADIQFGPWDLRQWCEGLVKIADPG